MHILKGALRGFVGTSILLVVAIFFTWLLFLAIENNHAWVLIPFFLASGTIFGAFLAWDKTRPDFPPPYERKT